MKIFQNHVPGDQNLLPGGSTSNEIASQPGEAILRSPIYEINLQLREKIQNCEKKLLIANFYLTFRNINSQF